MYTWVAIYGTALYTIYCIYLYINCNYNIMSDSWTHQDHLWDYPQLKYNNDVRDNHEVIIIYDKVLIYFVIAYISYLKVP